MKFDKALISGSNAMLIPILQQAEDQQGAGAADESLVEFHATASYALMI